VAQLLTHKPATLDALDSYHHNSAVHLAVFGGHNEVVAQLLNHKAAAEDCKMDFKGRHLLHLAAENCSGEVVALLLAHNPRLINERETAGQRCIMLGVVRLQLS